MSGQFLSAIAFTASLAAVLLCGRIGAADDDGKKDDDARREQQLKNMKRSAAQHVLTLTGDLKRPYKLNETAVMRFLNPVAASRTAPCICGATTAGLKPS